MMSLVERRREVCRGVAELAAHTLVQLAHLIARQGDERRDHDHQVAVGERGHLEDGEVGRVRQGG